MKSKTHPSERVGNSFRPRRTATLAAVLSIAALSALADESPPRYRKLPKYVTPVPYAGIRNWHVTQNLGPIGARGWVAGDRNNTTQSREILVKAVVPGAPADGILRPYDLIVGVGDQPFISDARLALAGAITEAERARGGGKLPLLRWRDGTVKPVVITIPVMGDYSATAPFNCPKTTLIVRNAAANLARNMPAPGFGGLTGALDSLFLFGCGEDRYLDLVRRSACNMSVNHTITDAGHETWRWGYCNLFLSEYYLATGDERVLPTINEYCNRLADGQCNPGTWGHCVVENRIPPGYGSMNQSGLICFMSLVLGRACGATFDENAIVHSIDFYGRYAGRGDIPYGDHPWGSAATANGKNGSGAVAFHLLGAEPAAQWFARMCASADLRSFEGGHTGNFFNQTWTPLGAALAGRAAYENFWRRFNSYRDLARRWDGSFVSQPFPNKREGDLGTGNYTSKGPEWATGGFALSYLADNKTLAILGRKQSVFAKDTPAQLQPALARYQAKRFEECADAAGKLAESAGEPVKALALQLKNIAQRNLRSIDLTLADMQRNLEAGDLYTLKFQLQAIGSLVDGNDPRLKPYADALQGADLEAFTKYGQLYDRYARGYAKNGPKGFYDFVALPQDDGRTRGAFGDMARHAPPYYRQKAREWLDAHPAGPEVKEVALVSGLKASAATPAARKTFQVADPGQVRELVMDWKLQGALKVFLNNTKIMDFSADDDSGTAIVLKPSTLELLKKGENVLSLLLGSEGGKTRADCALKASVGGAPDA